MHTPTTNTLYLILGSYSLLLFAGCMICHTELFFLRPPPKQLATFYLIIALGGALGGIFVNLIAPQVFNAYLELPLGLLALFVVVMWSNLDLSFSSKSNSFYKIIIHPGMGLVVFLVFSICTYFSNQTAAALTQQRNFYGTILVRMEDAPNSLSDRTSMYHNGVAHGFQLNEKHLTTTPTGYYHKAGGLGVTFSLFGEQPNLTVGIVGLGAGVIATYGRSGDIFKFYEINPDVIDVANKHFSFLSSSKAETFVIAGDARLSLAHEPDNYFDLIVVDAFSGGNIPAHLITTEAFALYKERLKPNGVLSFHISNNFLDLAPILFATSSIFKMSSTLVEPPPLNLAYYDQSTYVITSEDHSKIKTIPASITKEVTPSLLPWHDDFYNILEIIK